MLNNLIQMKDRDESVTIKEHLLKTSDCVDHKKLWKILKEMGIPGHLTCLLRNLYADQEAIVRTLYGTRVIEKGI